MIRVIVIGGGAAGLMAAGTAAKEGAAVFLFEKNDQPGKKILITGNGRCNVTNDADVDTFIQNFPGTGKFLYSALYTFGNWQLLDLLKKYGVLTRVEEKGKIYPVSEKARDVVNALVDYTREYGVKYYFNQSVKEIVVEDKKVIGIKLKNGEFYSADRVILTTGGLSYPGTGSAGDGYKMAKMIGHTIHTPMPSLVPLITQEDWVGELQGLALKNVKLTFMNEEEIIEEQIGEMLFTDSGITGPLVFKLSRDAVPLVEEKKEIKGILDLKPDLTREDLDLILQKVFSKNSRKELKNSLGELLPRLLVPVVIKLSKIPAEKKINQITHAERNRLLSLIKGLTFTIVGHKGFNQAIVTRGGVDTKEINPHTMESKLISGLYFAGEVIDIDGYTGGFNLQAAFSTGYLAGFSAAKG